MSVQWKKLRVFFPLDCMRKLWCVHAKLLYPRKWNNTSFGLQNANGKTVSIGFWLCFAIVIHCTPFMPSSYVSFFCCCCCQSAWYPMCMYMSTLIAVKWHACKCRALTLFFFSIWLNYQVHNKVNAMNVCVSLSRFSRVILSNISLLTCKWQLSKNKQYKDWKDWICIHGILTNEL